MQPSIDFTKLIPCADVAGDDPEDTALLEEMIERGTTYLARFAWARQIRECYLGDISVGGVVAVLLFRIEPSADVDEWLWVVIGDLPPRVPRS